MKKFVKWKTQKGVYQTKCSVSVLLFPNPNSSWKAVIISADGTVSEKCIPRVITVWKNLLNEKLKKVCKKWKNSRSVVKMLFVRVIFS